jgi:hypothetical protein
MLFRAAIAVTVKAAEDKSAPLPAVPVWADAAQPGGESQPAAPQEGKPTARWVKMDLAVLIRSRESGSHQAGSVTRLEHEVTGRPWQGHAQSGG